MLKHTVYKYTTLKLDFLQQISAPQNETKTVKIAFASET